MLMNRSILSAVIMAVALIAWMLSGLMKSAPPEQTQHAANSQIMTVQVTNSLAQAMNPKIKSQGYTLPNRELTLRAQTTGNVEKIYIKEGDRVSKGDVIASIDKGSRLAKLEKAKALVKERKSTYLALEQLGGKGYSAKTRIYQAQAEYKEALAQLEDIELDLSYTQIKAPFAGHIDKKHIEIGDFLSPGAQVAILVDNNPLIVRLQIPQQKISAIGLGNRAYVRMATGIESEGVIRFISKKAQQSTRTFRVEISVPNDNDLASGVSTEAQIPTKTQWAHYLSPSVLVLGLSGAVGVMSVDTEGFVHFLPVNILSASAKGVWLSRLPHTVAIITRGQGFVENGQLVRTQQISRLTEISTLFSQGQNRQEVTS
jgi:membrane fusion protein, multidrug efflux system